MSDPSAEDLSTRFREVNNRPLTPSETQGILTTVHENNDFFDPDIQTVFILGHYGQEEKPHLKAVQEQLDGPGLNPRLMEDVFDFTEDWTAKFKLLLSYVDTIVGVYEHSHGGHCWEAGFIDQYKYRTRTQAFYRIYEDDDDQYEAYNGMFWTHMLSLKNIERARPWTDRADLLREVDQLDLHR